MRRGTIIFLACITASGLIASVLYMHRRTNDWNKYSYELELIRDIRLQNALANQELLMIRYSLFSHYDNLEISTIRLRESINKLQRQVDSLQPDSRLNIPAEFYTLTELFKQKTQLQEQLKSTASVFKNIILRIPTMIKTLNGKIGDLNKPHFPTTSPISPGLLLYDLINDGKLDDVINEYVNRMGQQSGNSEQPLQQTIKNQIQYITTNRKKITILMDSILSTTIDESARRLQQDYRYLYDKQHIETKFYRNTLYVVSIILVIYAAVFFIKLMQKRHALAREKDVAHITLQSIGDGVITTDANGIVQFLNPVAEQLTQWKSNQAQGKELHAIFNVFDETSNTKIDGLVQQCIKEKRKIVPDSQSILVNRYSKSIAIEDSVAPILDAQNHVLGAIIVFRDVSDKRELSQQLSLQASRDALTGVINRRGFDHELALLTQSVIHEAVQHALLYIDLDEFKVVNDTCGHDAGDELLIQITALIQHHLPENCALARLGGDEFGILLREYSLSAALNFAEHLLAQIKSFRFHWHGIDFQIGASIGLAQIDKNTGSSAIILSAADMACYVAKDFGRNRVHVFNQSDRELVRRQGEMKWVARLTEALKENRFILYRQAILPTNGSPQSSNHYELLLRLRDSAGNIIMPNQFIPAAERYNLIQAIDRWVIKTAFTHYRWNNQSDCFSINLSGSSLNDETLVSYIKQELEKTDLSPKQICFEITETAAITNMSATINMMTELKKIGINFALDDFGKGLSSYSYINNLPVDYLKIDGEFVLDLNTNPVSFEIIRSVNEIGHLLGMKTIAEYVENKEILQTLNNIGIDYVQGYNFGHPEPLDNTLAKKDNIYHLHPKKDPDPVLQV